MEHRKYNYLAHLLASTLSPKSEKQIINLKTKNPQDKDSTPSSILVLWKQKINDLLCIIKPGQLSLDTIVTGKELLNKSLRQ